MSIASTITPRDLLKKEAIEQKIHVKERGTGILKRNMTTFKAIRAEVRVCLQTYKITLFKCQCFSCRALIGDTFQIKLEFRSVGF